MKSPYSLCVCGSPISNFEFLHSFIHSFIHQWLYSTLLGPGLFFSFVIFLTQTVGLLGWGISPSQGRYLHTGQHRHRINGHTDIHALSGIRTDDPNVRASEDSSCLTPLCYCEGHQLLINEPFVMQICMCIAAPEAISAE
jgi:hypothetical protein